MILFSKPAALRENCPYSENFGPYFLIFRLITEGDSVVSLLIQFECGKIRTIKTPNIDTFHAVQRFNLPT